MEDAFYYAKVAMLAYQSPYNFGDADIDLLNGSIPHFIDCRDCQVLAFRNGNAMVFAFRGADACNDIYYNLHTRLIELRISGESRGYVHTGFLDYYHNVRDDMMRILHVYLEDFAIMSKSIVFIGHSLGGASCMLAAMECAIAVADAHVSCYTFGAPRVGNRAFVRSYMKYVPDNYRFVCTLDPIPHLPPPIFFRHPGGAYRIGPAMGIRAFITQIILLFVFSSCTQQCLVHHDIRNYIRLLMPKPQKMFSISNEEDDTDFSELLLSSCASSTVDKK